MVLRNDLEDRFGHLLQPIRDLAKLWDVDVASYLTDYLDELEKITITFDEGKTTMNFAEAALLIQGSTSVYSKKVENLYSLVYQVMDAITSKKGKNKKSSSDNNMTEGGVDNDDDDEFLSLDDIYVAKNITMKEGDKSVLPVKLTPLSIIPIGSTERDQNPLLSKTGELLGSRDDFRMNTCFVHKSGAMLIDTSFMPLLLTSLQGNNDLGERPESVPCETIEEVEEPVADVDVSAGNEPPPTEDVSMGDDGAPPLLDHDDHDDNQNTPPKPAEPEIRARLRSRKPIIEKVVERKPLSEVFVELDPYSASEKPDHIGKGKVIKTPVELRNDDASKKRKRKQPHEKPKVPISVFIQTSCFSHQGKYNKTALNTPSFYNLENQYWKEYVHRKKIWAKEKKLLKSVHSKQLNEFEKDREDEVPVYDEFGGGEDDGDDDANVDNLEADAPAFNMSFGQEPMDMIYDSSTNKDELTSYEELARQHIERFMACGNYVQSSEIAQKVAEWEEKMLPRLEEEEKRPAFDIHLYGTHILEKVPEKNRMKFSEIAVKKPDHEICRMFSALLQLVNGGNIKIHKSDNFLEAMDEFELELLSMTRHHEELANKQYESG